MILTAFITTAAAWTFDGPIVQQFKPDTSYKLFGQQDRTATILDAGKQRPVDWTKACESGKHSCCPSSCCSKYHFKGHGKTTAVNERQINNQEVLRNVLELSSCPLDALFNTGQLMLCAGRCMRQCHHVICSWTADNFGNIHLQSINQPDCPLCEAPKWSFGEGNSLSWQIGDYRLYFQKMILASQGDVTERWEARQYVEDRAVGTSEGVM